LVARNEDERHPPATQLALDGVVRAECVLEQILEVGRGYSLR
jgi:hypothetical protein